MEVKGVAFLARQAMVVHEHGEPAWREFIQEFAQREPLFKQLVMPVTRLPVDAFLRLNEALVRRFYGGDSRVYWQFGFKSAVHAMEQGQLKLLAAPGDFRRFALFTPSVWKSYYTEGELHARFEADYTEVRLSQLPRPHLYFEFSVMGFCAGGLAFLGAKNLRHEVLKGFSKGHNEVLYRFYTG